MSGRRSPAGQLAAICLAVLVASSTWFAGTAVGPALSESWQLSAAASAWLTISVQLGFILGTVAFALGNIADVFSARSVFAFSALAGAAANAGFAALSDGLTSAITFRVLTGITLAGVYPVAMKIVASWFQSGLGWRLGLLIAALTTGTSLPYLARALGASYSWRTVAGSASVLAALGALVVLAFVRDGPHLRSKATFDPRAAIRVFRDRRFRLSAIGYFGHMWELYAVWALIGAFFATSGVSSARAIAFLSFAVVAAGALGCAVGGWVSRRFGERSVALGALTISGTCCLLSPLFVSAGPAVAVAVALVWGVAVVTDSPQLSALAAQNCPPQYTATALTIQNGIGFAITIGSLQLLPLLGESVGWRWAFLALAPGPIAGALALHALGPDPPHAA